MSCHGLSAARTALARCVLLLACSCLPSLVIDPPLSDGGLAASEAASDEAAGSDVAPMSDGAAARPSCQGLPAKCGKLELDCCDAPLVPGGTFPMGRSTEVGNSDYFPAPFDWDIRQSSFEVPEHAVTVGDFHFGRFEVTVARFRQFTAALPFLPDEGAGGHPHLPGSGWQSTWNAMLPASAGEMMSRIAGASAKDPARALENSPITGMNWYEALAFCIWDGGRLPLESEWEYAAAGGDENRLFPWASNPSVVPNCDYANGGFCGGGLFAVGDCPAGVSRWGQYDLAGNAAELVFDAFDPAWYSRQEIARGCDDCANVPALNMTHAVLSRGGDRDLLAERLRSAARLEAGSSEGRSDARGFRCAYP